MPKYILVSLYTSPEKLDTLVISNELENVLLEQIVLKKSSI